MNFKAWAFFAFSCLIVFSGCGKKSLILVASGSIEAKEVELSSRIMSRVVQIVFDEGSFAEKGKILAKLDKKIVQAQKDSALAIYNQAMKNVSRSKNLFETQSITEEQYEFAETQLIKALSEVRQANIMLDEANIYAPWDGIILERNVEIGELVSPNASIFTFGDLTKVYVTIYVPLVDIGRLKLNQEVRIKVDSFKDKVFKGTIVHISGEAEFTPKNVQTKDERVKEVFAVKISVSNPYFELKPGMPADVEIDPK